MITVTDNHDRKALRAVIYARVSTDAQERDGTSLEGQVEVCQLYVAK
jgi:predicted site-specific integrase-resolvase